jgi:hypothetical protein
MEAGASFDSSQGNAYVTVTKLGPDRVDGSFELAFSDGSRVKGAFAAPICKQKYVYEVGSCRD